MGTKKSTWIMAVAAVLAWALVTGGMDRRDAEITAAAERDARDRKADITPADYFAATHPLECATWIAKCPGHSCRARYTCAADLTRKP